MKFDRLVTIVAAVTAPVLLLLTDAHVLSTVTAADIGGIVTALIVGYHTPDDAARVALAAPDPAADPVKAPDAP